MGIAQPTGGYADQMVNLGGWPQVDEDAFYDRARGYTQVLRQLAEVSASCRRERSEIFDGGAWTGSAASAADGELGSRIGELTTLQEGVATVITWHRYVAGAIHAAKSDISDNVESAHQQISVLENDPGLDAAELTTAINTLVRETHEANISVVTGTAEQIRSSTTWTPPGNAVDDLLDEKAPPPLTPVPEKIADPAPGQADPAPANPGPDGPQWHVQPVPANTTPSVFPLAPTPFTPNPAAVSSALSPGVPNSTAPGNALDGPTTPLSPNAATQPQGAGGRGRGMAPASISVAPAPPPFAGVVREDSSGPTAAAANGLPAAPMTPAPSPGAAGRPTGSSAGPPIEPKSHDKRFPVRPAAATRPITRGASDSKPADRIDATHLAIVAAPVPVSAARAERDAVAEACTADAARRHSGGNDPLRLARHVAAALNATNNGGEADFGFFWVTAVTTDDAIVVANSYGLAYIPDGVQLPQSVHMATADEAIAASERAGWATYPVLAVQGWAAHRNTKLRAVIGTEEQLANTDPGAPKILLAPDDIPANGDMIGRSRLEVVDPATAARLASAADRRLLELLPPAPADAYPGADTQSPSDGMDSGGVPDLKQSLPLDDTAPWGTSECSDRRPLLWFEVMKPMTSSAPGRHTAHLHAFRGYCAHVLEVVLKQAQLAADPGALRIAVADWLYWKHLADLLDAALADGS